jgi:nucleotide-binding universal stress UspA family protein
MAFKDLLVLAGAGTDPASAYALWLAGACGANLTAAAPVAEPSIPPYVMADMPDDILIRIREDAERAAETALAAVSAAGRQAGATVDALRFEAATGSVGDALARLARCYDLTILPQPDPTGMDTSDVVEGVLFGSGRPLVVVPYIQARPEIRNVLIAWDGGAPAARVISHAVPLLAMARHVEILSIGAEAGDRPFLSGRDLARHLARHGITSEPRRVTGADIGVSDLMLSHAADIGADLIVMGGYGHSRLREIVLGGATREILRSMTVPVLMSH